VEGHIINVRLEAWRSLRIVIPAYLHGFVSCRKIGLIFKPLPILKGAVERQPLRAVEEEAVRLGGAIDEVFDAMPFAVELPVVIRFGSVLAHTNFIFAAVSAHVTCGVALDMKDPIVQPAHILCGDIVLYGSQGSIFRRYTLGSHAV